MYLGKYQLSFNGHNRITLPKAVRQSIRNKDFVILMEGDGCIWGFGWDEFEIEAKQKLEKSLWQVEGRIERRKFFSSSVECELDRHSRLVIPADLIEKAGILEEMVLIGAGDHFEIWAQKKWKETLIQNT